MAKEAYVSFEVAKLLKDKGFDEPCHYYYRNNTLMFDASLNGRNSYQHNENIASAPTHQMAMKWLREVHDVYIDISIYVITKNILKYNINVYYKKHKNDSMYLGIHLTKECSKYEEAVEIALKYTLVNLI